MAHFDLPLRNRKDLARAAQMRNYTTVGRPFNSRSALPATYDGSHEPYLPVSRRIPDRSMSISNPYYPSSPITSYQSAQPLDLDTHFSHHQHQTQPPYAPSSHHYPRRTTSDFPQNTSARLSFAKAARALYNALDGAARQAERLETSFEAEIHHIPYADERTRAHLWTLKVEYRGWNVDVDAAPEPAEQLEYFPRYAGRLLDAIEDMREAEGPSSSGCGYEWGERGNGNGNWEDVRLAMKKLGVSFGAIAELLEGVREDKGRCQVLFRELKSAVGVLNGVREYWELRKDWKGMIPVPAAFTEVFGDEYSQA